MNKITLLMLMTVLPDACSSTTRPPGYRPVAYYSDRYGVFRVNKKGKEDELFRAATSPRAQPAGEGAGRPYRIGPKKNACRRVNISNEIIVDLAEREPEIKSIATGNCLFGY